MDPYQQFKENQKQGWAHFAPLETMTTPPAARLVKFAGVQKGDRVLDVACGTGVTSVTAARLGAKVTALDLTPQLLERARESPYRVAAFRRAGAFGEAAALAETVGQKDEATLLKSLSTVLDGLERLSRTDLNALEDDEAANLAKRLREAADRLGRRRRR